MRLLAVCGSLRAASSNAALLHAAKRLAPPGVDVVLFDGLATLPHFNPDEEDTQASSVRAWRNALAGASGVLVCSPEYAHGIPGALKNALDWVVGSGEFVAKPVALLNASPRSVHAQAQLREVLTTMDARVIDDASIAVPVAGRRLDAEGIAKDPALAGLLAGAVASLARAAG